MGRTRLLLDLIDEAFDRKSWHGTTLLGSIRGVTGNVASWRPAPGRHNMWELTVHAAYWKYAVRRRLTGEKRGTFTLTGSNWFVRPIESWPAVKGGMSQQWNTDVRLLVDEHRRLRQAVQSLTERSLDQPVGRGITAGYLVRGIAAHDLYHAGQIQLLKRLRSAK